MNKAKELLDELKNLDIDIQSRIDEIKELEASLISSPKWNTDKVQGGQQRKVDDVYSQLVTMKESLEQDTNEIIKRKMMFSGYINKLKNPVFRSILRMTYISKYYPDDVCDILKISRSSYYMMRKDAISELDELLSQL